MGAMTPEEMMNIIFPEKKKKGGIFVSNMELFNLCI